VFRCCGSRGRETTTEIDHIKEIEQGQELNRNENDSQKKEVKNSKYEENHIESGMSQEEKNLHKDHVDAVPQEKLIIEEKFIRRDERDIISFTKTGVMKFLHNFTEDSNLTWIKLFEKDNLYLDYIKGSPLTPDFLVGRCRCTLSKNLFKEGVTIEMISKYMYEPEFRGTWDKNMKLFEIYERG